MFHVLPQRRGSNRHLLLRISLLPCDFGRLPTKRWFYLLGRGFPSDVLRFWRQHDRTEISVRRLYKHLARCTCGSFNFSSSQTTSGHVPSTFERSRSHSFRRFVHFNFFFGISDQIYFKILGKLFPCLGGIF